MWEQTSQLISFFLVLNSMLLSIIYLFTYFSLGHLDYLVFTYLTYLLFILPSHLISFHFKLVSLPLCLCLCS
ncbi:uncharacterized protein BDW47DRAFT_103554 [Aspergillus candidus]|uniref:Uncharacterized protein n=1 Tax=Aspergillus candidus TaxID=41067 RepID=A0A2I2FFG7_ASPCN|nr:hypothetical protein BDW47DRAFT_103554 [Aspergillus candidus]PLB39376.1 hypothetical protein BDW47DRAFT_103554 [Aspergillus candidus]